MNRYSNISTLSACPNNTMGYSNIRKSMVKTGEKFDLSFYCYSPVDVVDTYNYDEYGISGIDFWFFAAKSTIASIVMATMQNVK